MSKQYVAVTVYKILRDHAPATIDGCESNVKDEPDRFNDLHNTPAFTRGTINCLHKLGYLSGLPGGSESSFEPGYAMSKQYVAVTVYKTLRDHAPATIDGCERNVKDEPDRFNDLHNTPAFTRGTINCLHKLGYLSGLPGGSQSPDADTRPATYKAVTAGGDYVGDIEWGRVLSYSCALRTDNTITCWGSNEYGNLDAPKGRHKTIDAGSHHSCALRTDNTITCWGLNDAGQTDAPDGQYTAVAAGGYHSCAIRSDNTITCWGSNWSGETDPPDGRYKAVAAGGGNSCAIRTDNTITCWGLNDAGQTDPPDGQYKIVTVGSGNYGSHLCALRTDNTITCWGWDDLGRTDAPDGRYKAVDAGYQSFVRHRNRQHDHMLGMGIRSTRRPIQGRHRRRHPFVRHQNRQHHHLLGQQRIRANRPARQLAQVEPPLAMSVGL